MVRTEILVRQGADFIVDNATEARYQLASVSKQFTAAAVLLLAGDGALSLDDTIGHWLDGCPDEWRDITLHHLLTHTSGLGHWDDYPMIDLCDRVEPGELLETFHRVPLPVPTGQHDASGMPLPTFELEVVGMGAGDIWSTARDLLAWLDALQDGRLLSEPHRTLMLTERARTGYGPKESGYGYGVFVGEVNGQRWWHHDGQNAGFTAFAANIPEQGRRIVMLSNTEMRSATVLEPPYSLRFSRGRAAKPGPVETG